MPTRTQTPGLQMRFQDYLRTPGVNFSTLKHMRDSPRHYQHALQHPPTETTNMLLGRATHTAVFEPERFQLEYATWPGTRRGNAFKSFQAECDEQGRSVLREKEHETSLAIKDAVRGTPEIEELLGKGRAEVSLFWRNPHTGVECKGRLDWIGKDCILDLKTTQSIEPGWFANHAWRMGYFHQAAMYQEGYSVASGKGTILRAGIIAVERDAPHGCRLFWLDEDSLELAWREYVGWLEKVLECSATGNWPGPEPVEEELSAPAWAVAKSEEDIIVDFDGVEEVDDRKAG